MVTRWSAWAGVGALTAGIFVLITLEQLPIGVLTVMAADLGVSAGVAGLTVTAPGVIAAAIGVVTPVISGRLDRRMVLVVALGSAAVSCVLAVFSPDFVWLMIARVFAGFAAGAYWAVLPVVAVRQVSAEKSAKALVITFSGIGGALVLGVPLSSWLGTLVGWRMSMALVGAIAALSLVAVLLLVRPVHSYEVIRLKQMGAALRTRSVRYAVLLTIVIVTGQYVSYSYVSPVLQAIANVPVEAIGAMLLAFGLAGLVGNFAAGPVLRRSPGLAVLLVSTGILAALLLMLLTGSSPLVAFLLMPVWGLFAGAAAVSIQSFVTREAVQVEQEGTAVTTAMYNFAIAAGAFLGGRIIDTANEHTAVAVSMTLMVVGVITAGRWLATTPNSDR